MNDIVETIAALFILLMMASTLFGGAATDEFTHLFENLFGSSLFSVLKNFPIFSHELQEFLLFSNAPLQMASFPTIFSVLVFGSRIFLFPFFGTFIKTGITGLIFIKLRLRFLIFDTFFASGVLH